MRDLQRVEMAADQSAEAIERRAERRRRWLAGKNLDKYAAQKPIGGLTFENFDRWMK